MASTEVWPPKEGGRPATPNPSATDTHGLLLFAIGG
jgi:hypothetical protein